MTTQLEAGVWQHFAVSRRGRTLTHFLNGVVSASGDVGDTTFTSSGEPWRIGDWARGTADTDPAMREFVDRYRRFAAFEATKQYPLVYTRSIDITDYYRRHFNRRRGPSSSARRTICPTTSGGSATGAARDCSSPKIASPGIHPSTRSSCAASRGRAPKTRCRWSTCSWKTTGGPCDSSDECPNPIWWFDYTQQEKGPRGSAIAHTETPKVEVQRSGWVRDGDCRRMILHMHTTASMPDYAVAIWDLPQEFQGDRAKVRTNAKEFIVAWNREREYRLILFFDLKPDAELTVSLLD